MGKMVVTYADLGGNIFCLKFDGMIVVDRKFQREFERYMLLYETEGLEAVASECARVVGL
jgi:hypothetical protein